MRPSGRQPDQPREIRLTRDYTRHAEGSVLVEFGDTRVLCNASVEAGVPRFLRGKGQGWITAEYGMLPRATHTRGGHSTRMVTAMIDRLGHPGRQAEAIGDNAP